jgi:sphinganine-1-phosphate aldolase
MFSLVLFRTTRRLFLQLRGRGFIGTFLELYNNCRSHIFGLFLRIPAVRANVQTEVTSAKVKIQNKLAPSGPDIIRYVALPEKGWSEGVVLEELQSLADMDHTRWEDGYVSGAVYHGGNDLLQLQTEAFGKFTVANPLHPDVFPGVRKMEAEIVAMVLKLFNAPQDAAGVTTSGGSESIIMACLSAKNKALRERRISQPEM